MAKAKVTDHQDIKDDGFRVSKTDGTFYDVMPGDVIHQGDLTATEREQRFGAGHLVAVPDTTSLSIAPAKPKPHNLQVKADLAAKNAADAKAFATANPTPASKAAAEMAEARAADAKKENERWLASDQGKADTAARKRTSSAPADTVGDDIPDKKAGAK